MHVSPQASSVQASSVQPTLRRSTATGFMWLLFQALSGRFATFFSQLVLARLLVPAVFGQIGLAYTVTALVTALVTFGIDDVLLTRLRHLRLWVAPAFWSSLGLALAGMAMMLAAGPVVAHIYHAPGLVGLVAVLAINLPLGALSMVPTVNLRSALNFRYLGTYASIELAAVQLATIACAASGLGAYSFVLPLPVAAAIKAVILLRRAPMRLRPGQRRTQYRHLMGSGLMVLSARLVSALMSQGSTIVLGVMASQTVVGVYFFASRLAAQPLQMLAGNFGSVLFPALTQMGTDPKRQIDAALRASRILAFVVTPVCFMQAALAAPLLHVMFGARWDAAIPLVQILSLGLPGDAISWVAGALLVARSEFRRDFYLLSGFAVPFFACVVAGAWWDGALGVAVGASLYYALVKPLNGWLVFRHAMTGRDLVTIYLVAPLLAAAAIGPAVLVAGMPGLAPYPVARILLTAALGTGLYAGALRLFVPGVWHETMAHLPLGRLGRVGRLLARL